MGVGVRDARILKEAEVAALVKALGELLGPEIGALTARHGLSLADGIRFHAVGAKCFLAREELGLTIRAAAGALRVPQYRLKAIERSSTREVSGEIVVRYATLLEIEGWLHRWAKTNRQLASKLGMHEAALTRRVRRRVPSTRPLRPQPTPGK